MSGICVNCMKISYFEPLLNLCSYMHVLLDEDLPKNACTVLSDSDFEFFLCTIKWVTHLLVHCTKKSSKSLSDNTVHALLGESSSMSACTKYRDITLIYNLENLLFFQFKL